MADPSIPAKHLRAGRVLAVLRTVTVLHVLALLAQPVWAGLLLSGDYDMVAVHRTGANVASTLGVLQVLAAAAWWRTAARRAPLGAAVLLLVAESAQYVAGSAGALDLHVPLGVAVLVLASFVLAAAWRPVASLEAVAR